MIVEFQVGRLNVHADVEFNKRSTEASITVDLGGMDYTLEEKGCARHYLSFKKSKNSRFGHIRCFFTAYHKTGRWFIDNEFNSNPDPYQCFPGVVFWDRDDNDPTTAIEIVASLSTERTIGDSIFRILQNLPVSEHRSIDDSWEVSEN